MYVLFILVLFTTLLILIGMPEAYARGLRAQVRDTPWMDAGPSQGTMIFFPVVACREETLTHYQST